MFEETVIAEFEDLGTVNRFLVRVRLVERRGVLLVDIRKSINGAFTPRGIELSPAMVERLGAQLPAILTAAAHQRGRGPEAPVPAPPPARSTRRTKSRRSRA